MADFTGQPDAPWSWAPPEWATELEGVLPELPDVVPPMGAAPIPDPLAIAEYGGINLPQLPPAVPPPPPPPPPQRIGGPPIEETAGPTPSAADLPPTVKIGEPRAPSVANVAGELGIELGYDLPEPDAISTAGAFAPENVSQLVDLTIEQPPDIDMAGVGVEDVSEEERAKALAEDPAALAAAEQKLNAAQKDALATRMLEENERNRQALQRNFDAEQEARATAVAESAALRAEAEQLANGGYGWATKSTGQKVAGFIAAIAGGLVAGRTGGPNQGVAMIQQEIDRDLQARQSALTFKRGLLADKQAAAAAEARSADLHRIASYEHAVRTVETEMMQFDPKGRAAIEMARTVVGLRQAQAKAMKDVEDRAFKQAKDGLDLRNTMADVMTKERKLAGIGAGAGPKLSPAQIAAQYPGSPVPPVPMTPKEYSNWLETQKKGADVNKATGEAGVKAKEDARKFQVGGLVNDDNKPFEARSEQVADDLTKKVTAAKRIVNIIDRIDAIRERVGGESSIFNSDDKQELDVLKQQLTLLKKSGTQGMSSDADLERIEKSLGADDVTSFRAQAAGLRAGRTQTIAELNTSLETNGYKGKPLRFPNPYAAPVPKSSEADTVRQNMKQLEKISSNGMLKPALRQWAADMYAEIQSTGILTDAIKRDIERAAKEAATAKEGK